MVEKITNPNSFVAPGRYEYLSYMQGDRKVFSKKASTKETAAKLKSELLRHDFMKHVASSFPESKIRSPTVVEDRGSEIIFEYIDAPFVSNPDDKLSVEDIERLASTLAVLDEAAANWSSAHIVDESYNHTPYNNVSRHWEDWRKETKPAGLVTEEMMEAAKNLLADYAHYVTPRLQHGDFTPWHVFKKDDEWIIYDGEHASPLKPRFFDLAYLYSRVFTRQKDKKAAALILRNFIQKVEIKEDDFFKAFLPTLVSRSLGMFLDALHDKENIDYTQEAKDLFDKCMAKDINFLLKP